MFSCSGRRLRKVKKPSLHQRLTAHIKRYKKVSGIRVVIDLKKIIIDPFIEIFGLLRITSQSIKMFKFSFIICFILFKVYKINSGGCSRTIINLAEYGIKILCGIIIFITIFLVSL